MDIERYCGRERLPGGERRWRRLARAVGFTGTLHIQGFGVGGEPGETHRRLARGGIGVLTFGDFSPGLIRVWVKCYCAAADVEDMDEADAQWSKPPEYDPLATFAHELGHHILHRRGRAHREAVADRYGQLLLAHVP